MEKSKRSALAAVEKSPLLLSASPLRHGPSLFLRRLLTRVADEASLTGLEVAQAHHILKKWADREEQGILEQKETALDKTFVNEVFGQALGYRLQTDSPEEYELTHQFPVPQTGTADAALGLFRAGQTLLPRVMIEIKSADTDLDRDKSSGRTPVQQLWDYLREMPDCPWGILSNFSTIRLYHRNKTSRVYQQYSLKQLRDDPPAFRQFYAVFERGGLLGSKVRRPRAQKLLLDSENRQREVGDELYEEYSQQRSALIHHLIREHGKMQDEAIGMAQKILDRIIFVAFCEDRGLLPENTIQKAFSQLPPYYKVTNPKWQNFKHLFGFLDQGNPQFYIPPFNGGLFRNDPPGVDDLELSDEWTNFFARVGQYDFQDEVNVDVLGQLFEKSITELEKLRVVGFFGPQSGRTDAPEMPPSAERKRFGIYYTPPAFTRLIVEKTVGALLAERVYPREDPAERAAAPPANGFWRRTGSWPYSPPAGCRARGQRGCLAGAKSLILAGLRG